MDREENSKVDQVRAVLSKGLQQVYGKAGKQEKYRRTNDTFVHDVIRFQPMLLTYRLWLCWARTPRCESR